MARYTPAPSGPPTHLDLATGVRQTLCKSLPAGTAAYSYSPRAGPHSTNISLRQPTVHSYKSHPLPRHACKSQCPRGEICRIAPYKPLPGAIYQTLPAGTALSPCGPAASSGCRCLRPSVARGRPGWRGPWTCVWSKQAGTTTSPALIAVPSTCRHTARSWNSGQLHHLVVVVGVCVCVCVSVYVCAFTHMRISVHPQGRAFVCRHEGKVQTQLRSTCTQICLRKHMIPLCWKPVVHSSKVECLQKPYSLVEPVDGRFHNPMCHLTHQPARTYKASARADGTTH